MDTDHAPTRDVVPIDPPPGTAQEVHIPSSPGASWTEPSTATAVGADEHVCLQHAPVVDQPDACEIGPVELETLELDARRHPLPSNPGGTPGCSKAASIPGSSCCSPAVVPSCTLDAADAQKGSTAAAGTRVG